MFSIQDRLDYRRMRAEGTSDSYWNAGYLQGMPISSNLKSTTTTGKSLVYNGTEWSTGDPAGMTIGLNLPSYDGQVLTYNATSSSWTNEYPRNLRGKPILNTTPVTNQILGFDGTSWVPVNNTGTQGPAGTVAFGNVIVVDKINGTNTGTIDGNAVQDIETAIAKVVASGKSGITIWVMPGTYTLSAGITIPASTTLRGVTLQGCIIEMLNVVADTTLITMGSSSRLEDFTINLSSSSDVNLTGILFPNQTSTTAKIRVCLLNVTSTVNSLTKTVCGILGNGTTTNPSTILSTNAVQRMTTNVTSSTTSTTTGIIRGWYFTGALQFSVRDTVTFANGNIISGTPVNAIGIETTNTDSLILVKASTISGTLQDIKQPIYNSGNPISISNKGIQLCASDLINSNAGSTSFTTNIETPDMIFSTFGNIGSGTHYLFPGTAIYNGLSEAFIGIPFHQDTIVFGGILSLVGLPNSGTVTINLYNDTSSNPAAPTGLFATLTATAGTPIVRFNNISSTFRTGVTSNYLHVQLITSVSGGNLSGVYLVLATY